MFRLLARLALVIYLVLASWGKVYAEADFKKAADFYNGLASVIEANIDNPKACMGKLVAFYKKNQAGAKEARTYLADTISSARSLSVTADAGTKEIRRQLSEAIRRNTVALDKFAKRYPEYSQDISILMFQNSDYTYDKSPGTQKLVEDMMNKYK